MKYTYSKDLLTPINEAFSGVLIQIKNRFKIGKSKTNVPDTKIPDVEIAIPNSSGTNNIQQNRKNSHIEANIAKDPNDINLEFKRQSSGKINKEYDSIQIDFEPKEQTQYIINNNQKINFGK